MTRHLTPEQASAAYDVLVEFAGEHRAENRRDAFIWHVSRGTDEYRFCGSLGYGGKFRNNGSRDNIPYVDCYRYDETPARLAAIKRTNAALAALFGESGA